MTSAERTQILSGLQAHLTEELTETHRLPAAGGHGFGRDGDGPQAFSGGSSDGSTQSN